jgi:hypothetical protein
MSPSRATYSDTRAPSARRFAALAVVGLLPAIALAPASHWDKPFLLLALAGIALISLSGMVAIKHATFLDAEFVAVLLALGFLGPLPAACIWLVAEAAYFVFDRHRLEAHLANVASYGWAVVAGAIVLSALGRDRLTGDEGVAAFAALAPAAIAMLLVNFAITRGIVAVVLDGHPIQAVVRDELIRPAPATLAMIATGIATAFLYVHVGILALVLFAAIVVIPQAALPILLKPKPVSDLPYPQAVALYARVLAQALHLDQSDRLVLEDASNHLGESVITPAELSSDSPGHCLNVREAVLYYRENWDAPGGIPGAVGGEMIPLASRILAVADVWSRLTAAGSPGLTHSQALGQLGSRAGLHFDPSVVAAVAQVVEAERLGLRGDTAYEPRLYRLPMPRLMGRLAASAEPIT